MTKRKATVVKAAWKDYAETLENLVRNIEHAEHCNHRLGFLCNCHYSRVQLAMWAAKANFVGEDDDS